MEVAMAKIKNSPKIKSVRYRYSFIIDKRDMDEFRNYCRKKHQPIMDSLHAAMKLYSAENRSADEQPNSVHAKV
jgi:hypothetical protein